MKRLSNGASNAFWTVVCLLMLGALAACDNSELYCYKGHDEVVAETGGRYTMRVCDEWRNTAAGDKYSATPK